MYKFFSQGSLKDHLNQTKPTNGSYWKRYGRKTPSKGFSLEQIKTYGRFILDALNFIYSNGLVYGHLHSGNIYYDKNSIYPIKLFDLSNSLVGVSSKYRCYISELKQIRVKIFSLSKKEKKLAFLFICRHLSNAMSMLSDEFFTKWQWEKNVRQVHAYNFQVLFRHYCSRFY